MDSTTRVLTILILLTAMVVSVIITQFIRRRPGLFALRPIEGFRQMPRLVGAAIESNRPIHVSLGNAGLGGRSTLLTLASAELFYQLASQAAIGDASPILTISDTSAIPLGQDTLRRAYAARGRSAHIRSGNVRWYPAGTRSLAFAAALTATLADDRVASNVLAGNFGTEIALPLEAAARRGQSLIATSDQLEGQAIAYAMSDYALIGEEVFAAGAYLGGSASQVSTLVTMDMLRWLLILALLAPTVIAVGDAILDGRFTQAITRLLGGG